MEEVKTMSHEALLLVLRECPVSDYFGQSKAMLTQNKLGKQKAQTIVAQMVRRVSLQLVDKISEEEKGQSSFGSGSAEGSGNQNDSN